VHSTHSTKARAQPIRTCQQPPFIGNMLFAGWWFFSFTRVFPVVSQSLISLLLKHSHSLHTNCNHSCSRTASASSAQNSTILAKCNNGQFEPSNLQLCSQHLPPPRPSPLPSLSAQLPHLLLSPFQRPSRTALGHTAMAAVRVP